MSTRRTFFRTLVALAGISLGCALPLHSRASGRSPVVVIVAQGEGIKDVSRAELRRLFLRQTDNIDGKRMVPFNHPPRNEARTHFDRSILGMTEAEVGRYWIDRKVRGESGPPRTVPSPDLLRRVVARLPGAISYVPSDQVDDTVRVVTVDGKGPTHPDYPLR